MLVRPVYVPLLAACLVWAGISHSSETPVDFEADVAPILSGACLGCHSPNIRKGDFSLESIGDALESDFIVPGDADASHLVDLITSTDGAPAEMPAEGDSLTDAQVDLVRRWINQGAKWPERVLLHETSKADATWWSLQPLESPALDSIDGYIDGTLAERKLNRNPPADRRTLLRRVHYDLTGLPPSADQVQRFVESEDPNAYERIVDQLLASPLYGQHWGRHWLDVVRFGESRGFERNRIIDDLWPFRDHVIDCFNADKPIDAMIRDHLAGDVLGQGDPKRMIGSAFLVAGAYDEVGNQDPEQAAQIRSNTIDEIIRATSDAFLGMTVGCARCHDHKFDPIRQADYYRMYATFAGVRHASVPWATEDQIRMRAGKLRPLEARKRNLEKRQRELQKRVLDRGLVKLPQYEAAWHRPVVDRTGTTDTFDPVNAKFVRLVCEARDTNPNVVAGFRIDEFEVWSSGGDSRSINVALSSRGGVATGKARDIRDFEGAYGPQLVIDGKSGARFISAGTELTVQLPEPTLIDRIVFSSARGESNPEHRKFEFVGEYRLEISIDGESWTQVASGKDRKPCTVAHRDARIRKTETTPTEAAEIRKLKNEIAGVARDIAAVPRVPTAWIGKRVEADAKGPFHVFVGGSPQRNGQPIRTTLPRFVSAMPDVAAMSRDDRDVGSESERGGYPPESDRRVALANWITDAANPLTPRVLANRIWHYHFGHGIVATPNDFGYMGSPPSHPELLDFLTIKLLESNWRLKPLHRMIVLSKTYRQSSEFRAGAAGVDADSRLLWRFPPRRLSAEEIRDSILQAAGKLDVKMGGPGFRLYDYLQDNVSTYVPLDRHGPETYRRAVYHQNARASVVDLMTEFDQPDCAFSIPRRNRTTTPLQALTMLNHSFTTDMAEALALRIETDTTGIGKIDTECQVDQAYAFCFQRKPNAEERATCMSFLGDNSLSDLCRVLLNTTELIYVR